MKTPSISFRAEHGLVLMVLNGDYPRHDSRNDRYMYSVNSHNWVEFNATFGEGFVGDAIRNIRIAKERFVGAADQLRSKGLSGKARLQLECRLIEYGTDPAGEGEGGQAVDLGTRLIPRIVLYQGDGSPEYDRPEWNLGRIPGVPGLVFRCLPGDRWDHIGFLEAFRIIRRQGPDVYERYLNWFPPRHRVSGAGSGSGTWRSRPS
jgi:hypothetical protein